MTDAPSSLFNAYREGSTDGLVPRASVLDAFSKSGILEDDPRYGRLHKALSELKENISWPEFQTVQGLSPTLFEQVLTGQVAIPHFAEFCKELKEIFDKVAANRAGKLANYIPQLESVDPEKFALSICSINGQRYAAGDADDFFCVQSCSKPITYCLALEQNGEETVHQYVGTEPSGKTFNELTLNSRGLPHNPMINAGAIMCGSLVSQGANASDRFKHVMDKWRECAGNMKVGFDNAVYLSEKQTADRNFALGYFMREKKAFPKNTDLHDVLEFYFQCCSIEVTTKTLSVIAATLANGGNCPLTGVQVFRPDHVKNCLSLMSSCGLYDFSGEFAFRVGIPGKSGISGAIMLVVPNVLGMAIWSPRLDELGNSVRGVDFCKHLVSRYKFHSFDSMVGLKDDRVDPRRNIYEARLAGVIAFCCAASQGDVSEMRRLVAKGVDPNAADYSGRTALHLAASEGQLESLNYLLALGVDVKVSDRWGATPLDDAIKHEHPGVVSLLQKAALA